MTKMKIILIGYTEYWWNQCRILKKSLELLGHEVIHKDTHFINHFYSNAENLNYHTPIKLRFEEDHDLVIVCQTEDCYEIETDKFIIYYHSEFTWSPSCVNFDLLVSTFPECFARFYRRYPQYLKNCNGNFLWIKHLFIPEEFPDPKLEKKHGIFWMGATCTDNHEEYEQRTIYNNRAEIVGKSQNLGIIDSYMHNYSKDYIKAMSKYTGGLIVDGTGSYFSPRSIEYGAAGVIPIIFIGNDHYAREYYESAGFYHNVNCWMFRTIEELAEFNTLSKENTDRLSSTVSVLVNEKYRYDIVLNKLLLLSKKLEDFKK